MLKTRTKRQKSSQKRSQERRLKTRRLKTLWLPKREALKLFFLLSSLGGVSLVLIETPSFAVPLLLSLIFSAALFPAAELLERKKAYTRKKAAFILFLALSLGALVCLGLALSSGLKQWIDFKDQAPEIFRNSLEHLKSHEEHLRMALPLLVHLTLTEDLARFVHKLKEEMLEIQSHSPQVLVRCVFLTPVLVFKLLVSGRTYLKQAIQLVPNHYFESFFLVSSQMIQSIAGYFRAKLLEALVVGIIVTIGLGVLRVPYFLLLGSFAGLTNTIPYLGPFLGFLPALLVLAMELKSLLEFLPSIGVYLFANAVDIFLIMPFFVAKKIKLHPLVLLLAASLGQEFAGFLGILAATPIVVCLKIILKELYFLVYETQAPLEKDL